MSQVEQALQLLGLCRGAWASLVWPPGSLQPAGLSSGASVQAL